MSHIAFRMMMESGVLRPGDREIRRADLAEVLRLGGRYEEAAAVLTEAANLYERKGNRVSAANAMRLLEEAGSSSASP